MDTLPLPCTRQANKCLRTLVHHPIADQRTLALNQQRKEFLEEMPITQPQQLQSRISLQSQNRFTFLRNPIAGILTTITITVMLLLFAFLPLFCGKLIKIASNPPLRHLAITPPIDTCSNQSFTSGLTLPDSQLSIPSTDPSFDDSSLSCGRSEPFAAPRYPFPLPKASQDS